MKTMVALYITIAVGVAVGACGGNGGSCPDTNTNENDNVGNDDSAVTGDEDDAELVSQDVLLTVEAGARFTGSFAFRNTGLSQWSESGEYPVRLGFLGLEDTTVFGTDNRILLPAGTVVRPGDSHTFDATFIAPAAPGQYIMQWRLVRELVHWFGEPTGELTIEVTAPQVPARETLGRGVVALPRDGSAYVSWRLLPEDAPGAQHGVVSSGARFNLYRATSAAGTYTLVNAAPLAATSHHDTTAEGGTTYLYKVAAVDLQDNEGWLSEAARVVAGATDNHLRIDTLQSPSVAKVVAGDLDGDHAFDLIVVSPEVSEGSGGEYWLEAVFWRDGVFTPDWYRRTEIDPPSMRGASHEMPVAVWDLDGDGLAEVITRVRVGGVESLVLLDGLTGAVKQSTPWPDLPGGGLNDQGRNYLVIAYLDGEHPFVVLQRGLYSTQRVVAFDAALTLVRDVSFSGTSLGTHGLPAADIDGDGRDEILMCGKTLAFGDGGGSGLEWEDRWAGNPQAPLPSHHDCCFPADIRPDVAGLETFMGVEGHHRTAFVTDADGNALWTVTGQYGSGWERGWCADLDRSLPGLECYSYDLDEQADPEVWLAYVFDAFGNDITGSFAYFSGSRSDNHAARAWAMDWFEGEGEKELYVFTNAPGVSGGGWYTAWMGDLLGDSREEAIVYGGGVIRIFVNTEPKDTMYLTPLSEPNYRATMARTGVGYNSNYMPSLPGL
ncbi:MAG: NBR1-Ig-like domain-containing protein [bacterium]